jgi:APA family basic amino acid/polyamine antiporter
MGTLLAFAMVCVAVLILRIKQPGLDRPYKTPFIYFVAPAGALFNVFLMSYVRIHTWYAFLIWGAIGVLVYFLYSRKHSHLHPKG